MQSKFVEIIPQSQRQGAVSPLQPSDGMILVIAPRLEGHSASFFVIQTHPSRRFYLAVDFLGLRRSGAWSQIIDPPQEFPEQIARHGDFCHLVRDTPTLR